MGRLRGLAFENGPTGIIQEIETMRRFSIGVSAEERKELESVLRRQFVVRDVEDFITSFDPAAGDTLESALQDLLGPEPIGPPGLDNADLVIWRDRRIVAVLRRGDHGTPEVTRFAAE